MSTSSDGVAGMRSTGRRGVWNWFGAAFGISVLVGAGSLYATARTDAGTELAPTAVDRPRVEPADAASGETTGALLGLSVVNSLEVHELHDAYAEAIEIDERDVVQAAQALAALDAVDWPDELGDVAADFHAQLATFLAALEAGDLAEARHGLEAMHGSQHDLWVGVYAWLAGSESPDDVSEVTAPPTEAAAAQVIEIGMFEFGYQPDTIDIEAGVPVIFRFTNTGLLPHEAMVGDEHMQEEFAAADDHDDGQEGDHHGELMATLVDPGETKDLEVLIDEPGTWYVACHLIGHYEQGQIATINVGG